MSNTLRDLVYRYWSPSKDVKWLKDYYFKQIDAGLAEWVTTAAFLTVIMEQSPEDRDRWSDIINSAASDCCFMHSKTMAGDSYFFRKLIVHAQLLKAQQPDLYRKTKNLQKMLKMHKKHTVLNMSCSCVDECTVNPCEICAYRRKLLKRRFGGKRRKYKCYVCNTSMLTDEQKKLIICS